MTPRMFVDLPLSAGAQLELPPAAARHVQVLRLQPGDSLVVFNGSDGAEWPAEIVRIGRRDVEVRLGAPQAVDRELAWDVTIALGDTAPGATRAPATDAVSKPYSLIDPR